jgi:sulfide:quinone oxidoreductase
LADVVKKGNIKTHFGVQVLAIDGNEKTITFQTKETETQQINASFAGCQLVKTQELNAPATITLQFDLCHAVPPQSAPDFVKTSELADANNPYGYVEVDKNTLQHMRFANIFSLGDCSNAPCSKTGAAIRKQAPVVVANVLSVMANEKPTASYNGYSACPIPTQYGKLMLAEFDYTNTPTMTFPFNQATPRWSMWLLKTKILPWLYWHKILTGKA